MKDPAAGWPWATLLVVSASLALAAVPAAHPALEYERAAAAHEPWRLVTAQLLHWSAAMLAADLLLIAIAGSIVERCSRRLAVVTLVLGALGSAGAVFLASDTGLYRGSSGIGAALLVAAILEIATRPTVPASRPLAAAALLVLAAKVLLDFGWPGAVSLTTLPEGIRIAWQVHVAGALAGAAAWIAARRLDARSGAVTGQVPSDRGGDRPRR